MDRADDNVKFSEKDANESRRPIWLAGSALGDRCHVCAFFNNREEEYRVLLPFVQDGLAYLTDVSLAPDGALPRSWRKKNKNSTERSHEKFPEDPRCRPHGAKNRSLCPRSPAPTA